ncbi:Hypothetical predicted protein [Cloeon dipterum]|uniref:C-type lectin domain-containing protein n=1 Tax=Cloeon dipterum TaxID=197152 RepID=A0A8S1D943_9INSE|nr:Hypothetical predicted protein [Cloeon dipterum]
MKDNFLSQTSTSYSQQLEEKMHFLWVFLVFSLAPIVRADGQCKETQTMLTTLLTEFGKLRKDIDCLKIQRNLPLTTLENEKSYHFSRILRSWDEADTFCKSKMMALASPKTSNEIRTLRKTIDQFAPGEQWWVSATDVGNEPGNFTWLDGEILPSESSLWDKREHEPNDFGDGKKACVVLHSYHHSHNSVHILLPTFESKMSPLWIFLVVFLAPMVMAGGNVDEKFDEIKTMFSTLLTEVGNLKRDVDCLKIRQSNQALTTLQNGKTYHMHKKEVTWDEANTYCKSKLMALASPKTLDDLRLLRKSTQSQYAPGEYWLSATDAGREPGHFAWHDGEVLPRESQLWDKEFNKPNKFGIGNKTCVVFGSPELKYDRFLPYLPVAWLIYKGRVEMSVALTSFLISSVHILLSTVENKMSPLWIFLVVFLAPVVMADGNVEENIKEMKTMLAQLLTDVGNLKKDVDCVKIKQSLDVTKLENEKTYHMYNKTRSWDEAKAYCKSKMMELASPKTLQEVRLLKESVQSRYASDEKYWLSATDAGRQPGNFTWYDGEVFPSDSQLWDKQYGEPNNFGIGKASCVTLSSYLTDNYKLRDVDCLSKAYVFCESTSECQ